MVKTKNSGLMEKCKTISNFMCAFSNNYRKGMALLFVLSFLISNTISAQDSNKYIRQGNKLYQDSLYDGAAQKFSKALEVNANDEKAIYNQGNAFYQQKKHEEAIKNYELSAGLMENAGQKAAAYHNLGNSFFDSQQYEKSIEAYKNALRQNPNDLDTKHNLMVAKKMLENQQNQNQDQQNNQNQDQQDQKNQENQENQEEQNQENNQQQNEGSQEQQDQQENQGQNGEEGKDGEEQKQNGMTPSKLTPEEVKRILESLATDEQKTVKEIIKNEHKSKPNKSDKDW